MWRAAIMQLMKTTPPTATAASAMAHHPVAAALRAATSLPMRRQLGAAPLRAQSSAAAPSSLLAGDMQNLRQAQAAQAQAGAPSGDFAPTQGAPWKEQVIHETLFDPARVNFVSITGNLARDPEVRELSTGKVVAKMGIAHTGPNRVTEWYNVEAWDGWAVAAQQQLRKGTQVCVEGRLRTDQWVDKTTGQNRSAVKLVAQLIATVARNPAYPGRGDSGASSGTASAAPTFGQQQQPQYQPQQGDWSQAGAQPPPSGGTWGGEDQTQSPGAFGGAPAAEPPQQASPVAQYPPQGGTTPAGSGPKDKAWEDYMNNPGNYWDNRYTKTNPRAPDFKNKETNEALWLNSAPAWVLGQLESDAGTSGGAPASGEHEGDYPPF